MFVCVRREISDYDCVWEEGGKGGDPYEVFPTNVHGHLFQELFEIE